MSAGERGKRLDQFIQSPVAVMSNARCLTEGVDVPGIDAVVFAAPKQSTVDIVQASGRALRRAPGKKRGYVVIPIAVPDGMSFDAFAESTQFETIIKILAALSTQDERIVETLRARLYGPNPKGGGKRRERGTARSQIVGRNEPRARLPGCLQRSRRHVDRPRNTPADPLTQQSII